MALRIDELLLVRSAHIEIISLGNVSHCVDVCSEVGWVGFCSGAGGCMEVCGEEGGGWLAGWLAGFAPTHPADPPPPGGQKVRKSINLQKFAKFSGNS